MENGDLVFKILCCGPELDICPYVGTTKKVWGSQNTLGSSSCKHLSSMAWVWYHDCKEGRDLIGHWGIFCKQARWLPLMPVLEIFSGAKHCTDRKTQNAIKRWSYLFFFVLSFIVVSIKLLFMAAQLSFYLLLPYQLFKAQHHANINENVVSGKLKIS